MTVFKFNGFLIGAFVNVSVINENDANVIKQQVSIRLYLNSFLLLARAIACVTDRSNSPSGFIWRT
jgi:hypothetical protein